MSRYSKKIPEGSSVEPVNPRKQEIKKDSDSAQLEEKSIDPRMEVSQTIKLTPQEMHSLELFGHVNSLLKRDLQLAELEVQLCDCRSQLWAEKVKSAGYKKADIMRKIDENTKKNQDLNAEVSARLGIMDERWGFNPITGAVVGLTTEN